jgi:hypothetical protein
MSRVVRASIANCMSLRPALNLAAVLAVGALNVSPAFAQSPSLAAINAGTTAPSGLYGDPAHANLSGLWSSDLVGLFADYSKVPIPLTPAYAAKLAKTRKLIEAGTPPSDNVSRCIAFGVPRFMVLEFELLQTPAQVTLIEYVFHDVRRIYTDGSGHTPNVDPSYNGDSVGRWEGDTLVVDTIGLHGGNVDQYGVYHSDKLRVLERIRLVDTNKLEIEFTLTDPEAYTRPWVVKRTYTRRPPGSRYDEYVCENNRNDSGGGLQH